ncbi:hypothetical protein AUTU_27910 [Aureibacter tunicatorum]|nr:hypothetical protein AUTU_27910 [Aureibacter tunicatorum]
MPLQAKIGFEFEVGNWETLKEENNTEGKPHKVSLKKNEQLLKNEFFELKADETKDDRSDLEIATKAFEENEDGFRELKHTAKLLNEFFSSLEPFDEAHLPVEKFSGVGTITGQSTQIVVSGPPHIKPQVTMGMTFGSVISLFEDLGTQQEGEEKQLKIRRERGRRQLAHQSEHSVRSGQRFDIAMQYAEEMIEQASLEFDTCEINFFKSRESLYAVTMILLNYLLKGKYGLLTYPKAIASLISRTDFATVINMLHPDDLEELRDDHGKLWLRYWSQLEKMLNMKLSEPVFEGGIYLKMDNVADKHMLNCLTREKWLMGMLNGTDYLTTKHFPNPQVAEELESLGEWGSKTDAHPEFHSGVPIFELRSAQVLQDHYSIPPFMQEAFSYIYSLNKDMGFKFGEIVPGLPH